MADNSALYVIGSVNRRGPLVENRVLALRRARAVVEKIKADLNGEYNKIFYTRAKEDFQFTYNLTEKLHMITESSKRLLMKMGWGKRDVHVNESVIVLAIPCVLEMCKAVPYQWGESRVCNAGPGDDFYFKECVPLVCNDASGGELKR